MAWVGTGTKELNAALMFGDCDLSFLFFFSLFFYSHCFRFSVRGGSPIEKKKLTKVGRHDARRYEIHLSTLLLLIISGSTFFFDSEQQKWFIGGRDMGFWGFHLVGKKSKKNESHIRVFRTADFQISYRSAYTFLRAKMKKTPLSY